VATGSGTHVIDFGNPAAPRVTRTYSGSSTFRLAARGTHLIATINTPNTISKPSLGLFDLTSATFTPTLYDFNSTQVWSPVGVALSGDLALITSSQGVFGESRTFIAKYPAVVDRAGVPPVVRILMPATGDRVTEADHIPVEVTATDDVGVQQVSILANGAGTGPLSLAPYQTFVRVPTGVGTLTLSAIATDLEGNAGTASDVVLQVRPDPLTTVSGRVVDVTGTGIANATVDLRGLRTTTDASGSYTLANVASVPNAIMASAWGRVNNLFANGSAQAVAGANGFTTMPNIVLRPPNVGPLQSFPIPAAANAIAVHGTNAFVALGSSGLMILDLTNPLQPVHLTTMSLRSNSIASDLAFSGNMAYVAGGPFEGLHVVDITNPAQPVLRGSLRTGSVYHVAVSGTTVYIADASDTGGLDVVDASDPAAPVLVGTALNNRWAADVAMAGSYVVVFHTSTFQSSTDPRISVIDVSNPASPLQIGSVAVPGLAGSSLVVRGNSVMLVGGT
ncbi:MAG TPA: Ig-like domain-containing protein, partial [Actinoplanes sp.]